MSIHPATRGPAMPSDQQTTQPMTIDDLSREALLSEIAALHDALKAAGWEIVALREALGMNPYYIAPREA